MHIPLHLNLLSLALFSPSTLTMTIPHDPALQILNPTITALPTNSTLNSTSPANANRLFTCAQQTPRMYTRPGFADCAGVLRSLPLNPSIGTFYSAGPGDFQLPYFNTYKSCQVLVELQTAYDKVRSSWLAVQVAALELNEACQDLRMAPGLGYAYTFIDAAGKMKVTLQAPARTQLGDAEVGAGTS